MAGLNVGSAQEGQERQTGYSYSAGVLETEKLPKAGYCMSSVRCTVTCIMIAKDSQKYTIQEWKY